MMENIVITGIGVIAPNGADTDSYWTSTTSGISGLGPITKFSTDGYRCRVAGQINEFKADDLIPLRLVVQTDSYTHYGLVAADAALRDAKYDTAAADPSRMGVVTASSSAGNEFGQREIQKLWAIGPRSVGPYQSIAWFYAATTGQISIRHGLKGNCGVIATEGAGGLDVIGHGRRLLRREASLDMLLVGGAEAPVSPYALACQLSHGQFSTSADPESCYLPYSTNAAGYVPGEGAAILVLEREATAIARGAPQVYAKVTGYRATHEGSLAGPDPDGVPLIRAIEGALEDAGIAAADVDAIFSDGAAVPELDVAEVRALRTVFGSEMRTPVTVPKTMTGRLYAAAGAVDIATAALAIHHRVIPPTVLPASYMSDYDLPLVRTPVEAELRHVLLVARGHGGFNAAAVLSS